MARSYDYAANVYAALGDDMPAVMGSVAFLKITSIIADGRARGLSTSDVARKLIQAMR